MDIKDLVFWGISVLLCGGFTIIVFLAYTKMKVIAGKEKGSK